MNVEYDPTEDKLDLVVTDQTFHDAMKILTGYEASILHFHFGREWGDKIQYKAWLATTIVRFRAAMSTVSKHFDEVDLDSDGFAVVQGGSVVPTRMGPAVFSTLDMAHEVADLFKKQGLTEIEIKPARIRSGRLEVG